jgi:hypothetical protein
VEGQPGILELDALESSLLALSAGDSAEQLPGTWAGRSEDEFVHMHDPAVSDPESKASLQIPRDMPDQGSGKDPNRGVFLDHAAQSFG